MTRFTRRTFLKTSSLAIAATAIPYRNAAAWKLADITLAQDLRALTAAALDAARGAGAIYAEAHFRLTRNESWSIVSIGYSQPFNATTVGLSVRALVNGYWGFSAMDGIVSIDDAVRMGRDAAGQAKAASKGKQHNIDLASLPTVASGSWNMPVEID